MNNGYVYPIGVDDLGKKFQWVEDSDVISCERCCFWEGRCRYHELNKKKSGECFGQGYFIWR